MRWRALVVVKLRFVDSRPAELVEAQLRLVISDAGLSARWVRADPSGDPQFAYLRIDGRSTGLHDAEARLRAFAGDLPQQLCAVAADVVMWHARRRGPAGVRGPRVSGGRMSGGHGDGPGTAGDREPRRPLPPGFPPQQAAVDPDPS